MRNTAINAVTPSISPVCLFFNLHFLKWLPISLRTRGMNKKIEDVVKVRRTYLLGKEGVFIQVFKHLHLIFKTMIIETQKSSNVFFHGFGYGAQFNKRTLLRDICFLNDFAHILFISYLKFLLYSKWARTISSLIQVQPLEDVWSIWTFHYFSFYIPLIYHTQKKCRCGIKMLSQ